MCGIAGYFGKGVAPDEAAPLLSRMAGSLAHRGPDDSGVHVDGDAGLAHRRLSIIGLGDGHQPMASADGEVIVSYNGEIFNYVELRAALTARGHRFRTASDTEVILHLYAELGPDCLAELNGDFALALWDRRRRRMLLARDRMGVRPLFHARRGETLFFASETKALLQVPGITAELDPVALDQIFTLWAPLAPRTAFKGISELPPGHLMLIEDGRVETRAWWRQTFPDIGETAAPRDAAEALRALLDDATRIRLRADVAVGSYLSGGLDSSLVSALAARAAPGRLRTFSLNFEAAEYDEGRWQALMTAALDTDHTMVRCRAGDIAAAFPLLIRHVERPILRTAPAPLAMLSEQVRRDGFKVVLTGEGADEMFAGYDIFREARLRRFCGRQPQSRLRPLLFRRLYPYLPGLSKQSPEYLARFFGAGADAVDDPLFSHRPRFRSTATAKLFFSAELRKELGGYDAAEELAAQLPAEFRRWHPLHQAQYLETALLLPGYILSAQGDRVMMANGVEGRFPFLDPRIIDFAAGLPPDLKLRGLAEKHVLKQAARGLVPDAIIERPKQPYRAPDSSAFTEAPPDYLADMLSPRRLAASGLFNAAAVAKLKDKVLRGDASSFRDDTAFVGVLSTELWLSAFAGAGEISRMDGASSHGG